MSTRNIFLIEEYQELWKGYAIEPRTAFRIPATHKPAEGNLNAELFFIGEDLVEDQTKELFDKIIQAMGLERKNIYLSNIADAEYLKQQINLVKPKICVALGNVATALLLENKAGISALRGRFHPLPWDRSILVMPTYHPAFLLRNPAAKKQVWDDMKMILNQLKGQT